MSAAVFNEVIGNTSGISSFGKLCPDFALVYTIPAANASKTPVTEPSVTASPNTAIPAIAIGNLFRAPAIEKVVLEVARTHQEEQYEIAKLEMEEITIAQNREEAEMESGGRTE